jgi:short-subunit dehydrogenase
MPQMSFRSALITGASAGLGAEYARQLAAAGTGLILVARRLDRLEELATDLRSRYGVTVDVISADLSTPDGVAAVESRISSSPTLDLLVNNAGFGGKTSFVKGDVADHVDMVRVHVEATVRLTKAVLPGMIDRGRGAVVNVASVAAFSPFSGAMYSGTKSFLVMFSQNLGAELRPKGIAVQALCPGLTHTEFHAAASLDLAGTPRFLWMTADRVVRISLKRLGRGAVCIPGWQNKAGAFLMRCPLTAGLFRAAGRSRAVQKRTGGK